MVKRIAAALGISVGAVVVIVALVVIGGGVTILAANWNAWIAKKTVHAHVEQKVYQADNAIANVKYFHDSCRDVVAKTAQINQLEQEISTISKQPAGNDPFGRQADSLTQLQTQLTGLQQGRTSVAEQYNSRSAQYTANPFKDAGLPYRIDPPYDSVNCG